MRLIFNIVAFICLLSVSALYGQPMASIEPAGPLQEVELPLVFQIGEYEESYEHLLGEYPEMLLGICDNDMSVAYDKWIAFLMEIEQHAESIGVDILGVKMWLNVFWDKNGNIQHIAFHLKPNSKNISTKDIENLLTDFATHSHLNVIAEKPFSHYGSATFPTFPRRVNK